MESNGLQKYSDKPGREYLLWKQVFKQSIHDERLESAKELRLMLAWLGPESTDVVEDIYSAQLDNPYTTLDMLDQMPRRSREVVCSNRYTKH